MDRVLTFGVENCMQLYLSDDHLFGQQKCCFHDQHCYFLDYPRTCGGRDFCRWTKALFCYVFLSDY